jgi:pimeloyl-ACP methyl ester carboxylesterase
VRLGLSALRYAGKLDDPESSALDAALGTAYAAMLADENDAASPVRIAAAAPLTYVPRGSIVAGVVVLHGHGGAFALPCWQVARAVAVRGAATLCPSIGVDADWGSPRGEAIVRAALGELGRRGAQRLVLVGLSDGGVGATRLAPRLRADLTAVVAISGVDPAAPSPGVPTLVIQGTLDRMMSASSARTWAARVGARYLALPHGHFALLVAPAEPLGAIVELLAGT